MKEVHCLECGNQLNAIEADFGLMLGANLCVKCAAIRLNKIKAVK